MRKRPLVEVREGSAILDGREIRLPNVELIMNIASGAHGTVFEALDTDLDRKVAVKIWYKTGDQVRQGAIKEARRLAAITHPLFVTIYRLDVTGAAPYAMMELVPGPSLKAWLKSKALQVAPREHMLPYLSRNAEHIRQRCAFWFLYSNGLKYVYDQNALHGDPHTGNLIVVEDKTGVLKTIQNHHILRHGSYSALKILDLGTSFLWQDSSKREEREAKLIFETAERLFPDFPPREVMRIGVNLQPKILLNVLDRFAEYVLELTSVPSMTKTDFDFLSHGLPQLLGWCPFFNYSTVSDQLHVLLQPHDADTLVRDTRWHLENRYSGDDPHSSIVVEGNISVQDDLRALNVQSVRLQTSDWKDEPH